MDFTFINNLVTSLENNNIFQYTIIGAKLVGIFFLLLRFLEIYLKNFETEEPKIGVFLSLAGGTMLLLSGDWIIDGIETAFASVDTSMSYTSSDFYKNLFTNIEAEENRIFGGAKKWWDYIGLFFANSLSIVANLICLLIGVFAKLADLSLTASYLIQRIFIIKLLKFVFPLVIGFGVYPKFENLLYSWVKRYIGMFILGIAYIGIIKFMDLVGASLTSSFANTGVGKEDQLMNLHFGTIITIVICITIKIKLLNGVTSYVMNFFS